jgi:hypothetical protein
MMAKGKASGITLWNDDVRVVLGMLARGDRDHDIAAFFGVNQGRIAEVKAGKYGQLEAAPLDKLPPSGPPGVKGKRLRTGLNQVVDALESGDAHKAADAIKDAIAKYDANEG